MAAVVQTAANVKITNSTPGSSTPEIAGEAVTQGDSVYLKTTDGQYWIADNVTVAAALVVGIVLTPASAGAAFLLWRFGTGNVGATLAQGQTYALGAASEIFLESDIASGKIVTILGVGNAAGDLDLRIIASGTAHV